MRGCYERVYTSRSLARTTKEDAREGKSDLGGGAGSRGVGGFFRVPGRGRTGGRTSGSSGVTIQIGDGVVDTAPSQRTATGEPTTLTADERFSEENLGKVDEFVAQQMEQERLPSVVVGMWAPGQGEYLTAQGKPRNRRAAGARPTLPHSFHNQDLHRNRSPAAGGRGKARNLG
jgi:hypothetical protein